MRNVCMTLLRCGLKSALKKGVCGGTSCGVWSRRTSAHEWVAGDARSCDRLPIVAHRFGLSVGWKAAIGLLVVGCRWGKGTLARELLLEGPTKTGWQAVTGCVPKASWHAHGASAK